VVGGGLAGVAGCSGDRTENGTATDPPPTETSSDADGTPTDEPQADSGETQVVRLSPVEDPREVWTTGRTAIYPTDLIGWLRKVASHDRTLRKRVATSQEMPDPPLQVLRRIRFVEPNDVSFVDDAGGITGYYELDIEAGPYYEMILNAAPADPPSDAMVTPVGDLNGEYRELVVAAIQDSTEEDRVYSDTELAEWARESFIDNYYRYEGETYRGQEVQQTDVPSSSTEAWYELAASPSRAYDDATYLLLPDLIETVRAELDAAGVPERMDELVVEEPSESLVAFADQIAMLITHLAIFRVRPETA
jgi:hypothetical protein